MDQQSVYHIPNGTKNLATVFPSLPWKDIEEYYLEVTDLENETIATTCTNLIDGTDSEGHIRIYFLNGLGGIDAVNFCQVEEEYETKSDRREKPLFSPLVKSEEGMARFNVKANETYRVTSVFESESEVQWLKELFRSPSAWMEFKGRQGQPDDYLPIVISDGKLTTRKVDERYTYQVTIEYQLSNTDITIRN